MTPTKELSATQDDGMDAASESGFAAMGLPQDVLNTLKALRFTQPTPVQAQSIPTALAGQDILATAQTGTGKTAAFGIPLMLHLQKNPQSRALVLTPTRELAQQVLEQIQLLFGRNRNVKTALLIGGSPMGKQFTQLKSGARLIVGTPGRINDHLERRSLDLGACDFLVLDETDRMLDMGFGVQLERIFKFLPQTKQTLMFSATLPDNIVNISKKYLNNPKRITVGSLNQAAPKIKQQVISVADAEKHSMLLQLLDERQGSIIIFVKTKHGAARLADKLNKADHAASAIHGDLRQNQRNRVIQEFRDQKYRVLVATDVAARGLDIPHIEHVINYDLPQVAEDYIHRIGRTARAGAEGSAVCLITGHDRSKWREIERLMDPSGEKPAFSGSAGGGGGGSSKKSGKKRRDFGGEKRGGFGDKKRGSFGDKKRSFGGKRDDDRKPFRPFRPKAEDRFAGDDRPQRDKAPYADSNFDGTKKPFKKFRSRNDDRPSFGDRRPPRGDSSRFERGGDAPGKKPWRKFRGNDDAPSGGSGKPKRDFHKKRPGGSPGSSGRFGKKGGEGGSGKSFGGGKPFKGKSFSGKSFSQKRGKRP